MGDGVHSGDGAGGRIGAAADDRRVLLGAAYLPAKFRIRFLPPVRTDRLAHEAIDDRGLLQEIADEIRGRIQDEVLDIVGDRRSVWLG